MLQQFLPAELDLIQSRGSTAQKAGSLAGLHEKRKETLSQFFTPAWLVKFIWQALSPAFQDDTFHFSLFDNSIGAASMFRFADPARFHLYGLDADGDLVSALVNVLDKSPYRFDVVQASMEQVEIGEIQRRANQSAVQHPIIQSVSQSFPRNYPLWQAWPGYIGCFA